MNALTALYQTYLSCEQNGMVDNTKDLSNKAVLLPVFHTNKRSATGKDIIEVVLNEEGEFIGAGYLEKNEVIIFPVTEESAARSSSIAPHPLADELSYVSSLFSPDKHEAYLKGLKEWVDFNRENEEYILLQKIYTYLGKDRLIPDLVAHLIPGGKFKAVDQKIQVDTDKGTFFLGSKDFITFRIQTSQGRDLSVSKDRELHQNYIRFVKNQLNSLPQEICKISGQKMYCTKKHRGLMGNAKLISVSNHTETYYGRFKDGAFITQIGYLTSQKIHNMLKYLLENPDTSQKLDSSASLLTWSSQNLQAFDISITGEQNFPSEEEDGLDFFEDSEEAYALRSVRAKKINEYIKGKILTHSSEDDQNIENERFYVLIVDKVSNGRISIKYFRELYMGDLAERVSDWYSTTNWQFGYGKFGKIKTPSLYQLSTYVNGRYNPAFKRFETHNEKLQKNTMERLLPVIVDGKKIPLDIVTKMLLNVSKRNGQKAGWETLLSATCTVIKKYKWDYKQEEVNSTLDDKNKNRDYLYGRLLAVLELIESAATSNDRITNAEKLWATYSRSPHKTYGILMTRVRPYLDRLKKNNTYYYFYTQDLSDITNAINELSLTSSQLNARLNEDYILGYYAQRKSMLTKKEKKQEDE